MRNKSEKELRVALIDPVGGHGGMDFYDYGLLKALSSIDDEASFYFYTCEKTKDISIERVSVLRLYQQLWTKANVFRPFYFFLYSLKTLMHAKRKGVRILHYQFFSLSILNLFTLLLARIFFKHLVVTLHDVEDLNQPTSAWIRRSSLKLISKLIVHNQSSLDEVKALKVDDSKLAIVPHGSYTDFYPRLPHKIREREFMILFFGQLKRAKGLDILIRAFAKASSINPDLRLKIVGRPWKMESGEILDLIRSLNLADKISLDLTYIKNEAVPNVFEEADLLVLPYRKIYQSGVLLLAASMGRPILASNLSAFQEFITDEKNGFLFNEGDVEDLSRKLVSISTRDDLDRIVRNAEDTLHQNYNWKKSAKLTMDTYRSLVKIDRG